MIVRRHIRLDRVLWNSRWYLAYVIALATVVHSLHVANELGGIHIPFSLIGSLGTALAIFLAFRNNSAYDRWWEARKIWGGVVNASRTFARQVLTLSINSRDVDPETAKGLANYRRELVYRQLAWINALRTQLRNHSIWDEVTRFLGNEEQEWLLQRRNKVTQLTHRQAERVHAGLRCGYFESSRYIQQIDDTMTQLTELQGKAERIKKTPLPRQYDFFPRLFLFTFVTLLPLGMITELDKVDSPFMVVPLSSIISFMFYVLMRVGELNEDPFENRYTDTPLNALCRTIEIDLREQLGETDLPAALEPVDGILM